MNIYQDDNRMEIFSHIADCVEEKGLEPPPFFSSVKDFCFEHGYISENQYGCLVNMLNKFRGN